MAHIVLGIGTSHTPMLNVGPEEWPLFEELDRKRAHLHKDGARATYDELLAIAPPSLRAELVPERHAKRHGEAMAALGRLQQALTAAKLDAVVIVGDDQHEVYHEGNMPSVLVYRGETIANVPNRTTRKTDADVGLAAGLGQARLGPILRGARDAALSGPCEARPSPHDRVDRSRVRRRVRQCAAGRRGRGACLRLRPQAHHGRRGDPGRAGVPQHLLPAEPAVAAALLQARPGDPRGGRGLSRRTFASVSSRQAGSVTSPSTRPSTATSSGPCARRTPRRCSRCRASSSSREAPRSATGFAPRARSSIST